MSPHDWLRVMRADARTGRLKDSRGSMPLLGEGDG